MNFTTLLSSNIDPSGFRWATEGQFDHAPWFLGQALIYSGSRPWGVDFDTPSHQQCVRGVWWGGVHRRRGIYVWMDGKYLYEGRLGAVHLILPLFTNRSVLFWTDLKHNYWRREMGFFFKHDLQTYSSNGKFPKRICMGSSFRIFFLRLMQFDWL